MKYRVASLIFFVLILTAVSCFAKQIKEVGLLFDAMEKRTEQITSIEVVGELSNNLFTSRARLMIKSPDKFAIEFEDGSIKCFFNGVRLWIYVKEIEEVFYHFSDTDRSIMSYFSWFSPRRIFTNMTRASLYSLFTVEILGYQPAGADQTANVYTLKFTPRLKKLFTQAFQVGYYHMVIADDNFLPIEVAEFANDGLERGRLRVVSCEVNKEIDDSAFTFRVPPRTKMVPIRVVVAQKIQFYTHEVLTELGNAAHKLKTRILNWSF